MLMHKRVFSIKVPVTITSQYVRGTTHNVYGKIVISVFPAASFSFMSNVVWPHENYDEAVLKGFLKGMQLAGFAEIEAELVLQEIDWREGEYCWDSYHHAALKAVNEILHTMKMPCLPPRSE